MTGVCECGRKVNKTFKQRILADGYSLKDAESMTEFSNIDLDSNMCLGCYAALRDEWCNWEGRCDLEESQTSAEFQRMTPGKVIGMVVQGRPLKRVKKDKFNKLGLAETKLDLLKLEEEQLQEGKRLKAAILAAVLALGGMSSASAWGKAKKAPDLEQAIEQAVQKLPETIEIADEDYNLTKAGEELKAVAQKAGYTNEFETTGFNELCNYLADNDCVMLIGGKPFAKVGSLSTSYKAQKLAVERCGLFENRNIHSKQEEIMMKKKLRESKINPEDLPFVGPNNVIDYLKKWSKFENVEPFQHSENNRGFYFEANGQRYRVYKETPQMPRKWQGYVIETGEDRISDRTQLYRGAGYTELLADLSDLQKEALGKTLYENKRSKKMRESYDAIGVEIQTSLEDGIITESEANALLKADIKISVPDIPYLLEGLKKKGIALEDVMVLDYGPEKFEKAAEDLGFDGVYKVTVDTNSGWEDLYYGWNYASSKLVVLKKVTTLALAEDRKRSW